MILKTMIDSNCCQMVQAEICKDSGEVERKCISYSDYVNGLMGAKVHEEYYHLGSLPHGYVDSKISLLNTTTFSCVVQLPKARRLLLYYGEPIEVPFPKLYYKFDVVLGKVTGSVCFAGIESSEKLYHYPFGNVYLNGKVCWGNMKLPCMNVLADVDMLVSMFLSSTTNDDLYMPINNCKTQREFIQSIKGLEEFPDKCLVATENVISMLLE